MILRFLLMATLLIPVLTRAQEGPAVEASLISSVQSVQPGRSLDVAVRFQMEGKWHTYWKNGGDAGLATSIEWDLPEGWQATDIAWPAPERIVTGPLVSFGYEKDVLHLVTLTPPADAASNSEITLRAKVDWLECEEICVPGSTQLELRLPILSSPPQPSPEASLFEKATTRLPAAPKEWDIEAEVRNGSPVLIIKPPQGSPEPNPQETGIFFFPEDPEWMDNAAPQAAHWEEDRILLTLSLATNASLPDSLRGVLTREGGFAPDGTSLQIDLPFSPEATNKQSAASAGTGSYLGILFLGLIGGLILNLMPCVFPVLGIKVMNLVRHSGQSDSQTRIHGLTFTAGVMASFWALAALLLSLRAAGNEMGWGFQLQEPGFVFLLTLFLFAFGLNMSGLFEIGTSATQLGSVSSGHGYGGSFMSGILATVVATPCAAPFLATALGAALTLPAVQSLGLFTSIGLGLSLPFLLLTLFPRLTKLLPKPGNWMLILKQFLAFLLYGTVAFLLWVLVGQVGEFTFLYVLFSLVLLALAGWIYGQWQGPEKSLLTRRVATAATILLLIGSILMGWPRDSEIRWEPWSATRVEELRETNRPIYIDFTARWCATCQTNKLAVFSSERVNEAFRIREVALLKADWTNHDPEITRELKRWNRAAVPFNLLYLPDREEPVVLPEILTPQIVLDALDGPGN
jgi:DsbC/DsbD-like thiol-disulfide interchange protein/cytochrome c biogenesis protein CcdA